MNLNRTLELTVYFASALLFGLFVFLSFNVFVADSEFWSVSTGYYFFEDLSKDWVFTRPLFYFLLWLTQIHYSSPTESIYLARSLFVLNAGLILFFLFKLGYQQTRSYFVGAMAALLLLGNTGFMNQGFRIRSDLLAAMLGLAAIYFTNGKLDQPRQVTKAWLLSPLLATPKSILQIICLAPYLKFRMKPVHFWKYLILSGAFVAALIFLNWQNFIYLIHSFNSGEGGPGYLSPVSFFHLKNQFIRNPVFWAVVFMRLFTWKKISSKNNTYEMFTFFCFIFLIIYTEKVQFFIASLLPVFALFAAKIFYDLQILKWNKIRNLGIVMAFVTALIIGGRWFFLNLDENSNHNQLETLDATYIFLNRNPDASFYDFTCFMPPVCKLRHFVGPNQTENNKDAFRALERARPDLIFYIKKAALLEPDLGIFLSSHYADLGNGVFLRDVDLSSLTDTYLNGTKDDNLLQKYTKPVDNLKEVELGLKGNLSYLFGFDTNF